MTSPITTNDVLSDQERFGVVYALISLCVVAVRIVGG